VEAVPEGAGAEGDEAGAEAWLLALGGDAQVDIVAQPLGRVDVPVVKVALRVLRELDAPRVDVLQAVPRHLTGGRIDALVAQAGQDTGALGQGPDAVVLAAGTEADHVEHKNAAQERVVVVARARDGAGRV